MTLSRPRPGRGSRALRLLAAGLGLTLVTGCAGSVYDLPLPGGPSTGDDPLTVTVRFRDVLDLVPNSLVKINDVSVGKVTAVKLKGYTADVTVTLPKNTKLPDNAEAEIRQTSLLGEKFVSLKAPSTDPEGRLSSGDVIPLSRSGRNPEVEEVFSALSLLLNGGGVAQLRSIAKELNDAFGGREDELRGTLEQLQQFTAQLDVGKAKIVRAIESLNQLALAAKRQDSTIKLTLDELPASIASINSQRADLVKTLQALDNLSDVGVRVIRKTKADTIATVNDLDPILDKLADAGSAFPRSIQVALDFPFVDEAVGRNPQVARNLHLGDYVNLSVNLDIDSALLGQGCKFLVGAVQMALAPLNLSDQAAGKLINAVIGRFVAQNGACDQFANDTAQALKLLEPILSALAPSFKIGEDALQQVLTTLGGLLQSSQTSSTASGSTLLPQNLTGGAQQRRSNGGGVLGGVLGGQQSKTTPRSQRSTPTPSPSTGGGSSSGGGGLFGGLFGSMGMGRTATGFDVREGNGQRGDALNGPTGTASQLGYNSTLGALLLQGVSSS